MPSSTADRRTALRDRLVVLAEAQIAAEGLRSLRARDLATRAGCALGAIYTVFGDLGDLVLAVNTRTFDRLGSAVREAVGAAAEAGEDAAGQLIAMAAAYHAFARDNRHLWRALFEIERAAGERPPDWYMARMEMLLVLIEVRLDGLIGDDDETARRHVARTLFGAVHGVVYLALDEAGAGLPGSEVDGMIALMLRRFAGGTA